jgi:hypothetical protein
MANLLQANTHNDLEIMHGEIGRLPDDIVPDTLAPNKLPRDWNSRVPSLSTQAIATKWTLFGRSVALIVPSRTEVRPDHGQCENDLSLDKREAAIDNQVLCIHEAAVVRCKKQDSLRDLLWLTSSP